MKTIPVSSLVAGMLLPVVCHAQPTPPEGGPGRARPMPEERKPHANIEAWNRADLDHDGNISLAEFKAMSRIQMLPDEKQDKIFGRLDKDGDGMVSREEISRFGRQHDGKPMRRLWELDVDRSGGISLAEFEQGQIFKKFPPEKMEGLFRRLDTDGDGVITPRDKPEPPDKRNNRGGKGEKGKKFDKRGTKGGGEPARLDRIIEVLDTDRDGTLSFEEFRVGPAAKDLNEDEQEDLFEKLDRNGDKVISPADLPAPPPPPKRKKD